MHKIFSERLKALRGPLTQTEAAKTLGISQTRLSQYECGSREPNLATIEQIAKTYCVSIDWLFGLSEERQLSGARDAADAKAELVANADDAGEIEPGKQADAAVAIAQGTVSALRDIIHILAANGANASRIAALESRLAALEAHPLANARGVASSRSSTAIDA